MYTNKHGLSEVLRGIMEKRLLEGRDVALYTNKTLYKGLQGVASAIRAFPWTLALKVLLLSSLASIIAYGGVRYGDRVVIKEGFYRGCGGIAVDQSYDQIVIKDVTCNGVQVPTMLMIDKSNLEVVK